MSIVVKDVEELRAIIEAKKANLGKVRDELRELVSDLESLVEDASEAFELLDQATDTLSRQV